MYGESEERSAMAALMLDSAAAYGDPRLTLMTSLARNELESSYFFMASTTVLM